MLFSCTHWMLCIKEHHHAMQSSFHQMLQPSLWSNWAGKHELWESTARSICPTLGNILTPYKLWGYFCLEHFPQRLKSCPCKFDVCQNSAHYSCFDVAKGNKLNQIGGYFCFWLLFTFIFALISSFNFMLFILVKPWIKKWIKRSHREILT